MKIVKKIGLLVPFLAMLFFGLHQASAATLPQNFHSGPNTLFNHTFTYKNNQITVTLVDSAALNQPSYPITFTQNGSNKLEYDSVQQIFCANNVEIVAAPAKITLSSSPSGNSFKGTLSAYTRLNGGNCEAFTNNPITIQNSDVGSGGNQGLPATITYNGSTYHQIGNINLYGLTTQESPDCFGGSVIVTNAAGTNGTAYVGLQYNTNGGLSYLAPVLNKAGQLTSAINNQINGCGFPGSTPPTPYAGSISNGSLNAPTPTSSSSSGGTDTSSSCIDDRSLSWIICPVLNGLSKSADGIESFVAGQLNFNVQDNLSDSVHRAWTIFRTLTSVIIVIVMLVMVFSQAVGGGPFDAYTVRKMLPKLVAAIILMQISWPLCEYFIRLSNDAGQAIGQLMAAPFGGPNQLELGALIQRWSGGGAIIVGVATTGGLIAAIVAAGALIAWGWPVLLLAILLVFIAVVVALATLLVRNALIILLVMLAPLAFIAFVMPGADRYWKMWKDNFIRVLAFFPLVIALIYAGRIFAWIVAGLGTPGPFDLIMILAGFFGPYFFLPKTFKWAGPGVAAAYNAISTSAPIKRGREAAQKGLMERQQRNIDQRAKALDPTKEGYARATKKKFGIPYRWSGNVPRTVMENVAAGRVIPTKRGLANTIQRGEKWNADEEALEAARVKREKDKAAALTPAEAAKYKDVSTLPFSYKLSADGKKVEAEVSDNATARGKASLFINAGSADERRAGVAVDQSLKTSSWIEIFKRLVPVTDTKLQKRIRESGAEYWEGDNNDPATKGKLFVRMYDLPRYNAKVNSSEDLYPLPLGKGLLATPHITNPENKSLTQLQEAENEKAIQEGRAPRTIKPHHIQRALDTINGYMDAGNITSQSEAEFEEFGRLAQEDPDVSVAFGQLLHRIAHGGQGGINVLTHLRSSASMNKTLQGLLSHGVGHDSVDPSTGEVVPQYATIEEYLQEGQRSMAAQAPQQAAAPAQRQPEVAQRVQQAAVQSQPAVVVNQNTGGTLYVHQPEPQVFQLKPGESVSPGGVILSRLSRGAQEELNSQFESMRRELRDLKRMTARTQQQQQRLDEIQTAHPDWQDDDEQPENT